MTTLLSYSKHSIFSPNNIKKLISYGYKIIDPAVGHLACGYEEKGKLPKNEEIIEYVKKLIKEKK